MLTVSVVILEFSYEEINIFSLDFINKKRRDLTPFLMRIWKGRKRGFFYVFCVLCVPSAVSSSARQPRHRKAAALYFEYLMSFARALVSWVLWMCCFFFRQTSSLRYSFPLWWWWLCSSFSRSCEWQSSTYSMTCVCTWTTWNGDSEWIESKRGCDVCEISIEKLCSSNNGISFVRYI